MSGDELDALMAELLTTVTIGTGQVTPLRRRAAAAIAKLRADHSAALTQKDQAYGEMINHLRDEMRSAMADAHAAGFAEGIRRAAEACRAIRSRPETTDEEAVGALDCASSILELTPDAAGPTAEIQP